MKASWDEKSAIMDMKFHGTDVYYTPLVGNSLVMPDGVGWNDWWELGAEVVKSHVNQNPIGRYQRMMTGLYVDLRKRKVRSRNRYGAKAQWDVRDAMTHRYGSGTDAFLSAALRGQLGDNIVGQQEKISRDGILDNALHKFMHDGAAFSAASWDFSDLPGSSAGGFDIKLLEDVALRLAFRSENMKKAYGSYAQPVPGSNFRDSVLVMMSTGTYWHLWNTEEQEWMIDLRQLQDGRILNGGKVQYRNFATLQDCGPAACTLFNAGTLTKQVAVTSPIRWGDGATDPDSAAVDSMFYAGQSGSNVTHYVQCSDIGTSQFVKGDIVSIHTLTTSEYGITDGCDPLDGRTVLAEVYSADETNERLTFRDPLTEAYEDLFSYTSLNGSAALGNAYAFVTKAAHVHPIFIVGTREMTQFVRRRQPDGSLVQYHQPDDTNVDFPSVERVTANWYGETNPWELDTVEVFFCNAPFANRGAVSW